MVFILLTGSQVLTKSSSMMSIYSYYIFHQRSDDNKSYLLEFGKFVPGVSDLFRLGVDPVLQLYLIRKVAQQGYQILAVPRFDLPYLILLLHLAN